MTTHISERIPIYAFLYEPRMDREISGRIIGGIRQGRHPGLELDEPACLQATCTSGMAVLRVCRLADSTWVADIGLGDMGVRYVTALDTIHFVH